MLLNLLCDNLLRNATNPKPDSAPSPKDPNPPVPTYPPTQPFSFHPRDLVRLEPFALRQDVLVVGCCLLDLCDGRTDNRELSGGEDLVGVPVRLVDQVTRVEGAVLAERDVAEKVGARAGWRVGRLRR